MPAKVARICLQLAMASVLVAVFTQTHADADLWGHVRFGQDIVSTGTVRLPDRYSFTSDRPWINHEWLAEAAMAAAYGIGGTAGLIVLKTLLLLGMAGLVVTALHIAGTGRRWRDVLIGLLVVGTFAQGAHVRPQLFSLLMYAALLTCLVLTNEGSRERIVGSTLIMVAWANVHGGWIVGAATLVVWTAIVCTTERNGRNRALAVLGAVAAIGGTLVNPYGFELWRFLYETVGFGRPDIIEWQPVYRVGTAFVALWLLVAAFAATLILRTARAGPAEWRRMAIVVMLAVASFRVERLLAFFAIAVVVLLGTQLGWAAAMSPRAHETGRRPSALAIAGAFAIACSLLFGSASVVAGNLGCIGMESDQFPDPEVARYVATHDVRGRMVTWFTWGEYAIWHFWPRVTVSFDGRRETVYSDRAIEQQLRLYGNPADRRAIIDGLNPDYIWLPSGLALTRDLIADGWKPLTGGPSVLLAREGTAEPTRTLPPATRCFPGP